MKDFHKTLDITQSKFYKTLELNIYPMTQRKFSSKDQK